MNIDYEKAVEMYTDAADNGDDLAQCKLANMYREGRGVSQDYGEALRLYLQAERQGLAEARYYMGFMHKQGLAVRRDYQVANGFYEVTIHSWTLNIEQVTSIKEFVGSSKNAKTNAMYRLGLIYENGWSVDRDYAKLAYTLKLQP